MLKNLLTIGLGFNTICGGAEALSPIDCYYRSGNRYLQVSAGSAECSAVASVLNQLPGVAGVECYIGGGTIRTATNLWYGSLLYVPAGSTKCSAVASVLNELPGVAGVDCGAASLDTLSYLTGPIVSTECNAVANVLNDFLPCASVGGTLNDGTCECTDPTKGIGAACQYSDSKTCNGLGTAQYDGSCNCTSSVTGTGPTCNEYSDSKTCYTFGAAQPDGSCICFEGYTGDKCEIVGAGCNTNMLLSQDTEEEAAKVSLQKILPACSGISVAAVFVAYLFMTCSSDGTAFGDLPPAAHVWAWLSVGFKTFDLSTDWGFFFNSVRGLAFEGVYRFEGFSAEASRPANTGRYDPNVSAFQLAVMFFCTIGTMLTFADIHGSYRRLKGGVGDDAKVSFRITLSVILFEDIPQLVFVITYLKTILNASVGDVDEIAIISLVASFLNILFQIYLLFKDSKASKQEKAPEPTVVRNDAGFGFGAGNNV